MSNIVIILDSIKLGSIKASEITEIIMLLSSFNLKPNIVFRANSIWLLKNQQAELINQNAVSENWHMLTMFEPELYAETLAFKSSGLTQEDLSQSITLIDSQEIQTMIQQSRFTWTL